MRIMFALVAAVVLLSGCVCIPQLGGDEAKQAGPAKESFCPPNYIQVGAECCLDLNLNGICDKDEVQATSTLEETTSTLEETTSTTVEDVIEETTTLLPTTTTSPPIACYTNMDCGERSEERICYNGDVFLQLRSPICENPGKFNSACKEKVHLEGQSPASKPNMVEDCSEGCRDGFCL